MRASGMVAMQLFVSKVSSLDMSLLPKVNGETNEWYSRKRYRARRIYDLNERKLGDEGKAREWSQRRRDIR